MTTNEVNGQRYLCCRNQVWMRDQASILSAHFTAQGWKLPKRELPLAIAKFASEESVSYFDPSKGAILIQSKKTFMERWKGIVLVFSLQEMSLNSPV